MEYILDKVKNRVEAAEIFYMRSHRLDIGFEGWKLKRTSVVQNEGYSLRVIKNGKIGFAATTDPNGISEMIENAIATAQFGESVDIAFPKKADFPELDLFDRRIEELPITALIGYGRDFIGHCESFRDIAELGFEADRVALEVRIANTSGLDESYRKTYLSWGGGLTRVKGNDVLMLYDGSAATHLPDMDVELKKISMPFAEKLALANKIIPVETGRMPIIFEPRGTLVLLLPLRAAVNGRAFYTRTSPLVDKVGQKIFDEKLTILDDGTLDKHLGSSPFDDEGIPKTQLPLLENGVFKNFLFDLVTAAKSGRSSNGCASRSVFSPPTPSPSNIAIEAGNTPKDKLIQDVKNGILIESVLGLGQGNIISGTFSNPIGTAFKIENGALVGRVKTGTIGGNIYNDLKEIVAIGDVQELVWGSFLAPHIRVDSLNIAG